MDHCNIHRLLQAPSRRNPVAPALGWPFNTDPNQKRHCHTPQNDPKSRQISRDKEKRGERAEATTVWQKVDGIGQFAEGPIEFKILATEAERSKARLQPAKAGLRRPGCFGSLAGNSRMQGPAGQMPLPIQIGVFSKKLKVLAGAGCASRPGNRPKRSPDFCREEIRGSPRGRHPARSKSGQACSTRLPKTSSSSVRVAKRAKQGASI